MPVLGPSRLFKVVLVGNSSVGKTSLLRSFCEGHFHPSTTATVGQCLFYFIFSNDAKAKECKSHEKACKVAVKIMPGEIPFSL